MNKPKVEIDIKIIIVGDFKIPLSKMDKLSRQRINKKTVDLKNTYIPNVPNRHIKYILSNSKQNTHSSQVVCYPK